MTHSFVFPSGLHVAAHMWNIPQKNKQAYVCFETGAVLLKERLTHLACDSISDTMNCAACHKYAKKERKKCKQKNLLLSVQSNPKEIFMTGKFA